MSQSKESIAISVICPTYNSADYVTKALESIHSQNYPADEVLICDDGSTDDTRKVVEEFVAKNQLGVNWRIIANSHVGAGAARNSGIYAASNDWLAFLDSDDSWVREKLLIVTEEIRAHSDRNIFCHNEYFCNRQGSVERLLYGTRFVGDGNLVKKIYLANMFSTSAVVVRREVLVEAGGFDESLKSAQDYELWLRASPMLKPRFIGSFLGYYVEREGNITSGSLVKRMKNEIAVAIRHRRLVPALYFPLRLLRICGSYTLQFFRKIYF